MKANFARWARALVLLGALLSARPALTQSVDFELERPAGGSGPLLVLLTGVDGAPNHREQARAFAREGWLVHVVDSNRIMGTAPADALRETLKRASSTSGVRPGRAALVGYSLGGWLVLAYGSRMPEWVASAVAYYPSTLRMGEVRAFVTEPPIAVPTLVLAGVKDTYMNCCLIERARALATAATAPDVRAPLRLVEYPEADHGFVLPAYAPVYRPADEADAFRRAVEHLRSAAAAR